MFVLCLRAISLTFVVPVIDLRSHGLLVTIQRPWYTFDVVTFAPVALQNVMSEGEIYEYFNGDGEVEPVSASGVSGSAPRLDPAPSPRKGASKGMKSPTPQPLEAAAGSDDEGSAGAGGDVAPGKDYADGDLTEEDLEHMILIKDCGGLCVFDFGQAAYVSTPCCCLLTIIQCVDVFWLLVCVVVECGCSGGGVHFGALC